MNEPIRGDELPLTTVKVEQRGTKRMYQNVRIKPRPCTFCVRADGGGCKCVKGGSCASDEV